MDAPQNYKNAGLVNVIAGAFNIFYSLSLVLSLIWICVGVWWLIPAAASGYQAWIGWQMYQGQPQAGAKNAAIAGIVAGVFGGNLLCAAASAYSFMQMGQPEVAGWLEQNGAV